jgi:hypothetical protein
MKHRNKNMPLLEIRGGMFYFNIATSALFLVGRQALQQLGRY